MRRFFIICFVLCSFSFAFAQEENNPSNSLSALEQYQRQHIKFDLISASKSGLFRDDSEFKLGFFGDGYEKIFRDSRLAMNSMAAFQQNRIWGTTLFGAGAAVVVASLVTVIAVPVGPAPMLVGIFGNIVGLGCLLGGAYLFGNSNMLLHKAINDYNDSLFRRLSQAQAVTEPVPPTWSR